MPRSWGKQELLINPRHPLWSNCRGRALVRGALNIVTLSAFRRPRKLRRLPFLHCMAAYRSGPSTMYDYPLVGLN
jgi:hypothetical protein